MVAGRCGGGQVAKSYILIISWGGGGDTERETLGLALPFEPSKAAPFLQQGQTYFNKAKSFRNSASSGD